MLPLLGFGLLTQGGFVRFFKVCILVFTLLVLPWRLVSATELPAWYNQLKSAFSRLAQSPHFRSVEALADAAQAGTRAGGVVPDSMLWLGAQLLPLGSAIRGEAMAMAPTVGFGQTLPFPSKLVAGRNVAAADAKVARAQTVAAAQALALELAEAAFMHARLLHEQAALEFALGKIEALAVAAAARYAAGQGSRFAAERLAVEAGRMRAMAMRLRAELADHGQHWAHLLGAGDLPPLPADDDELWLSATSALSAAVLQNPVLAVERAKSKSAELLLSLERSKYWPDLALNVEYGVRGGGRDDMLSGMVGVSLPLWARRNQTPQVRQAQSLVSAAAYAAAAQEAELKAEIERLLVAHREAVAQVLLYKRDLLPRAVAARDAVVAAYVAAGLNADAAVEGVFLALATEREYLQAAAERRLIEAKILAVSGRLAPLINP